MRLAKWTTEFLTLTGKMYTREIFGKKTGKTRIQEDLEIISKLHKTHPGTWMVIEWLKCFVYIRRSAHEVFSIQLGKYEELTTRICKRRLTGNYQVNHHDFFFIFTTLRYPWAHPIIPYLGFGTLCSSQQGLVLGFRLAWEERKATRSQTGFKGLQSGKIDFIQSEMIHPGKPT